MPSLVAALARFNPRVTGSIPLPDSAADCYLALAIEGLAAPVVGVLQTAARAAGCDLALHVSPATIGLAGPKAALERTSRSLASRPEMTELAAAIEASLDGYLANLSDRSPTRVVGILNVTPDSFSDGGSYTNVEAAVAQARRMVTEGADWIDVGGESTRPGAETVPVEEELRRVLPVVEALASEEWSGARAITLSIDTRKAAVAERCLAAGATIVNDVSGLLFDPRMPEVVAAAGAGLVLMHALGTPQTMQLNPVYGEVVAETLRFLRQQVVVAVKAGIRLDHIWIDPGFGFGKTVDHNLEILRRLGEYTSTGLPVLIGTSRKSTIGRLLGGLPPEERLEGTAATVALSIANGARAIRVHDVREMARVARVADAIVGREADRAVE